MPPADQAGYPAAGALQAPSATEAEARPAPLQALRAVVFPPEARDQLAAAVQAAPVAEVVAAQPAAAAAL